jgi:ligand-binding sensor domain-containing protein
MSLVRRFFFPAIFLLSVPALFSQVPVFRNFSVKDGLPSRETYGVYQDSKGYIWICTDAGIARYNATSFKIFDSSVGLPDNTIFEVKEDKEGRIWFRSISGHVGYIRNDSVFTIGAVPLIIKFKKEGFICSLELDSAGDLFLGRQNTDTICFLKIKPPYGINDVKVVKRENTLRLGIKIWFIDKERYVFSESRPFYQFGSAGKFSISVEGDSSALQFPDLMTDTMISPLSRVFYQDGIIYAVNGRNFFQVTRSTGEMERRVFDSQVISVLRKNEKELLVGRINGLIRCTDVKTPASQDYISGPVITGIIYDANGGLWVSTLNEGIFFAADLGLKVYAFTKNTSGTILGIKKIGKNELALGTSTGELIYLQLREDAGFDTLLHEDLKGHLKYFFLKIIELPGNRVRLMNANGQVCFDRSSRKIIDRKKSSDHLVFKYLVQYKGGFLGSNYMNLMMVDSQLENVTDTVMLQDRITSLDHGEGDKLWVSGLRGLYLFDGQHTLLPSDRVLDCRVEDVKYSNGRLVAATKEKGVIIRYADHQDTLGEREGLLSNICRSLYLDGDDIWVIGNTGVSCISTRNGKYAISIYPLSEFEKVRSIEHLFVIDSSLFLVSDGNLYSYPIHRRNPHERFYIGAIRITGQQGSLVPEMDLPYGDYRILIPYEALFYSSPGRIMYRYRLHAADTSWNYTFENSIHLNSLSPGSYEIQIQAQHGDGSWKEADRRLNIRIGKPFWVQWWFSTLEISAAVILLAFCFVLIHKRREKRERERSRLQARMSNLEMKALKAQMNPHFIFNALNSVQQFVLSEKSEQAYDSLSRFSKLIRKMLESNTQENISLENEIDILHKYLEVESLRFEHAFHYSIDLEGNFSSHNLFIPHMLVQPFVENAIWHGLAPKRVDCRLSISFRQHEKNIVCSVEDNGIGREAAAKRTLASRSRSLGMEFIRERLELFSSLTGVACGFRITDLKDEQGEGRGTLVEIIIPLINVSDTGNNN